MPKCLHLLDAYLHRTETFIWQYLRRSKRYSPLVLADVWENLEQFPLPQGEFLGLKPSRSLWLRLQAQLQGGYAPVSYPNGANALKEKDIALCHAHNGYRACVTSQFVASLHKPLVVSFYGADVSRKDFLQRAKENYTRLFKQAKLLLVEGPAMRQKLIRLGAGEDKIRIRPIAIDPSDYPFQERVWDGNRPIQLLFVGRLVEKKGLAIGLQALANSRIDFPWKLSVVGDGPLGAAMKALVQSLGLENHVDFLGFRTLDAMRELMGSHDLLFQPSMQAKNGDSEGGAPTVILEAQACGMPILSTLHDDIPFITVENETAWLAPEGRIDPLVENLRLASQSSQSWATMGHAGRAKIEADHNVNREVEKVEGFYDGVV